MARLDDKEQVEANNWLVKAKSLQSRRGKRLDGFIDTSGGVTYADKACAWALHLCREAGVEMMLGDRVGELQEIVKTGSGPSRRVVGLRTVDEVEHQADVVVIACKHSSCDRTLRLQVVLGRLESYRRHQNSWRPQLDQ
jgi:sarcosine oxidase/L-pipecolate oxidase